MITLLLAFFVLFFSIEPKKTGNTLLAESLLAALEKLEKETPTNIKQDERKSSIAGGGNNKGKAMAVQDGRKSQEESIDTKLSNASEGEVLSKNEEKSIGDHVMEIMESILPIQHAGEGKFAAKKVSQKRIDSKSSHQLTGISKAEKGTPGGTQANVNNDSGFRKNIIKLDALQAEAIKQDDRIFIMFPTISFFSSASTALTKEGLETIRKFANVYLPFAGQTRLNIVGFSDQRPVIADKYNFKDNLELSVLRAVSAQRVLAKIGIPVGKVRLMGHGINTSLLKGENPKSEEEVLALARKIMFIIEPEKAI